MSLCVIVPRLPPILDGVGDYTVRLWQHYHGRTDADLDKSQGWLFLCNDSAETSARQFPLAHIQPLARQGDLLADSLESLQCTAVLLQYVGYGFHARGIPQFLLEGLSKWKTKSPDRRLYIMFHELFATAPPWRRTFWDSPGQQALTFALNKLADYSAVSNDIYLEQLRTANPESRSGLIPIGNNFVSAQLSDKVWNRCLIFGLSRVSAIKQHAPLLRLLCEDHLVKSIVLAGRFNPSEQQVELQLLDKHVSRSIAVETCYDFAHDSIPEVVASCGIALSHVDSAYLYKSGRFILSANLGQAFIALRGKRDPLPPLANGVNYVDYPAKGPDSLLPLFKDADRLKRIGAEARNFSESFFSWNAIVDKWREVISKG